MALVAEPPLCKRALQMRGQRGARPRRRRRADAASGGSSSAMASSPTTVTSPPPGAVTTVAAPRLRNVRLSMRPCLPLCQSE